MQTSTSLFMRSKLLTTSTLLLLISTAYAQLNPVNINEFFKEDTVPRIDIFINPDSLSILLEDISSDHEYQATFVYNNFSDVCDTLTNVGFRIRGNVSRTVEKKSFKISINSFAPGRKYFGLEKINLKATGDDSFIRPKLSWYLCQQMGIPSVWVNHVMLYINNDLWGVYTNVEHIDEEFIKNEFGNNKGNLYKCRYPATLEWISNNPDDYKFENTYFGDRVLRTYELKTNTNEDDYTDLMMFIDDLNNTNDDEFKSIISKQLNINKLLKFFALEVYMGHWDSYSFPANNFFLYKNIATDKFEYITYDMDLTMGINFITDDITEKNIYEFTDEYSARPLRTRILEVPEFRNNYTFYLKQLLERFPPDTLRNQAEKIQEFIGPFVAQDPFYTYEMDEFYASLDEPFGLSNFGIIEYFTLRYNSIFNQIDNSNTTPIVSNIRYNPTFINDSVKISCSIADDDPDPRVTINYRLNNGTLVTKDMNLTGTGKMPGVYHFESILDPMEQAGNLEFYFIASDTNDQTLRSPYESSYSLSIFSNNLDLRINELMASNTECITDKYGENDDWIEIYNADTTSINLANKYLSDSYNNPDEWQLPAMLLQPGQHAWFWADNEPNQGEDHAGFRLSQNGETIYLFEERGSSFVLLDSLRYPEQESNTTFGVLPEDSSKTGFLSQLTPGFRNDTSGLSFMIFEVNMSTLMKNKQFDPVVDTLDVIGNFNDWSESLRFYDTDNDSIYTQTIYDLSMGDEIQYRFRLNHSDDMMEFKDKPGNDGNRFYMLNEGCNSQYHYFNDIITKVNEIPLSEISLYPNPVSEYFHLITESVAQQIIIIDINGKVIKHINAKQKSTTVDMQEFSPGIYFIRIVSESKNVFFEKFIKL